MSKLPVKRVKRGRISDQVVVQLRDLLERGVLKPGQKIPGEHELAEEFAISRASIREALRTLETMGLIEIRSGSGAFVRSAHLDLDYLSENLKWLLERREMLLKVLQVREVLQGLAASLCAERRTEEELTALLKTVDAMRQAVENQDVETLTEADTHFHLLIADISGNEIVGDLCKRLEETYRAGSQALMDLEGRALMSIQQHTEVFDAIKAQDGSLAEIQMRAHIRSVLADLKAIGRKSDGGS